MTNPLSMLSCSSSAHRPPLSYRNCWTHHSGLPIDNNLHGLCGRQRYPQENTDVGAPLGSTINRIGFLPEHTRLTVDGERRNGADPEVSMRPHRWLPRMSAPARDRCAYSTRTPSIRFRSASENHALPCGSIASTSAGFRDARTARAPPTSSDSTAITALANDEVDHGID